MAADLARSIANAVHLPMDGFHRSNAELESLGLRSVKGAPSTFDVSGFVNCLRSCTTTQIDLSVPDYDRTIEEPIPDAIRVPASTSLVIVEGNYLLLAVDGWQEVARLLDEVWYLDLDPCLRRDRLIERHVAFGKDRHEAHEFTMRSDESNARLVEATRHLADFVVAG